jgi:homocysteine S-methyltransferase
VGSAGFPFEGIVVADGGLATELEAQGHDLSDDLWSARLLADSPAAIRAAHLAYFRAGAAIATTASYQASFEGFAARGIGRPEAARLLRRSVTLAREARSALADDGHPRWVAASVGPYGAVLANGQEYAGRYGLSVPRLRDWHRPRLEVLADAGADLLAVETVPDSDEAEAVVGVVADLGVPCWLSYTIAGDRTRAGQPLADAFAVAAGVPQVIAVGVNCCAPSDVLLAVSMAREITGKPVIAYPNSGESWDGAGRAWTGGPEARARELAPDWVAAGARIVGGCCRVTPADITAIAQAVTPRALPRAVRLTVRLAIRLEEATGDRGRGGPGAPGGVPSPLASLFVGEGQRGEGSGGHPEHQVRDREDPFSEPLGGGLVELVPDLPLHHRPHHRDEQDRARDHQRAPSWHPLGEQGNRGAEGASQGQVDGQPDDQRGRAEGAIERRGPVERVRDQVKRTPEARSRYRHGGHRPHCHECPGDDPAWHSDPQRSPQHQASSACMLPTRADPDGSSRHAVNRFLRGRRNTGLLHARQSRSASIDRTVSDRRAGACGRRQEARSRCQRDPGRIRPVSCAAMTACNAV